jgi:hypothetical protein
MSYDLTARNNALDSICEISLNGYMTKKLDFLGTIHIYGVHYFNVFRRYNSVYEIVIEDFHGDFHFHKDYTIRQSLQHILCLSDEQMEGIYTRYATSFKHGSCPMTSMHDAPNMHWSELQHQWQAAALDFGGILEEYHRATAQVKNEVVDPVLEGPLEAPLEAQDEHKQLEVVGTPCVLHAPLKIPYAPIHERTKPQQININLDSEAAEILLSLRASRKRGKSLSDRFKEVENKKRTWTQLSESESESDSEEEQDQEDDEQHDEQEEDEEDDQEESEEEQEESEEEQEEVKRKPSWCTVLRNGTTILRY